MKCRVASLESVPIHLEFFCSDTAYIMYMYMPISAFAMICLLDVLFNDF